MYKRQTAYIVPSVLIVKRTRAQSTPTSRPTTVPAANRVEAPSCRRVLIRVITSSATAAPATMAAETAPGSAYAVEVTSIAASAQLVILTRAEPSIPAAHASAATAKRIAVRRETSRVSGADCGSGSVMGARVIGEPAGP